MNFGQALEHLRSGKQLRRKSCNDVIQLVAPGSGLKTHTGRGLRDPIGSFIGVAWSNGGFFAWDPKHVDLLADDWEIVK